MQQGMRQGQANRARQLQGRSACHAPCPWLVHRPQQRTEPHCASCCETPHCAAQPDDIGTLHSLPEAGDTGWGWPRASDAPGGRRGRVAEAVQRGARWRHLRSMRQSRPQPERELRAGRAADAASFGYHAQARHAAAWVTTAVSAPASLELREMGSGAGGSRKRAGLARAPDQARGPAPSRARPGCRARPCAAGSARTRATGSSRRRWPGPAAWLPARAVGDTRCCLPCGLGTHGSGVRTPRALAYSWHGCDGCKQARPCCPA